MKYSLKQTTERRISSLLRVVLAVVLLLTNIAAVLLLTNFLHANAAIVFGVLQCIAVLVAIDIQSSRCTASYKLAWTLLVVAVPVAGMILYVLWGGNIQSKRQLLLPVKAPSVREMEWRQHESNIQRMAEAVPNWNRLARMLQKQDFLLYKDTNVTYFSSGDQFFADAISRMERAERFIFLEFFILAEGKLWDRMMEVLTEKARSGVEVKIIFDDFGNITRMRGETVERMREAGMEVRVFNPVHQYVNRLYFNYRDHRKIICTDGQYAYTGGVNVADEYAGFVRRLGEWKDSGLLLDGAGAWGLTGQFIHMWEMLGGQLQNEHDYYRPVEARGSEGWCQPFADGPLNNPERPAEDVYLRCIASARDYIWLTTPYFAVEDDVVRALCMAADSGVDVRLFLPGIWDHRYTRIVAGSHYSRLLEHGVKIYEFEPGFLHAKSFVCDGQVAMVGTVNMDYRSFQLHYECGVLLYDMPAIGDILEDMESICRRSTPVDPEQWMKRSWLRKGLEKVLRIFSIWM